MDRKYAEVLANGTIIFESERVKERMETNGNGQHLMPRRDLVTEAENARKRQEEEVERIEGLNQNGTQEEYSTGARRDRRDVRYDFLSPIALRRLAKRTAAGAEYYGDRNWEKGLPLGQYLDHAIGHLMDHLEGMRDEDHLAAAMWNIMGAIHTEEMIARGVLPEHLDDLPNYMPEGE